MLMQILLHFIKKENVAKLPADQYAFSQAFLHFRKGQIEFKKERNHWHRYSVFMVNFEHFIQLFLVFLLMASKKINK